MNKWFRKGNARRFHRVDIPLRYFIEPSTPIRYRDIFASGADYFPTPITNLIEARKIAVIRSVRKIQEKSALVTEIFTDVIEDIEFYGKCLQDI
ncbi:MAG TPA: hypothetical protein ENK73_09130 [Thiomicrospira sp.]|nr:hypothetical protein [Thiomicrospira sp.]